MAALAHCAMNFSEGRSRQVIATIVSAINAGSGAHLAWWGADTDHNRLVASIVGSLAPVVEAAMAAARVAVQQIDMREHSGVHPRLGAVDVVPFTPIADCSMEDCVAASLQFARLFSADCEVPVYLYEASARAGSRTELPDIRRGEFEGLVTAPLVGARAPDFGPPAAHPTAGACVVGARGPLAAVNVNLRANSAKPARDIASTIRVARGINATLQGVRALGFYLPSRGIAQVSMNFTQPNSTTLPAVFAFIQNEAYNRGVEVVETEIIGLVPRALLGSSDPSALLLPPGSRSQFLDLWEQMDNA